MLNIFGGWHTYGAFHFAFQGTYGQAPSYIKHESLVLFNLLLNPSGRFDVAAEKSANFGRNIKVVRPQESAIEIGELLLNIRL